MLDHFTSTDMIIFIVGQIVTAAAIWGGIKADIRALHTEVKQASEVADKAHERIDHHLERHRP